MTEQEIREHRDHGEKIHLPITLLVAPHAGRLRILTPRSFAADGEWVEAGQPVVRIERGQHEDVVVSPARGRLGGVLGQDGEPVKAGQAVAWMEPA
jgi:biotin carboxyl carrier protein